jgi:tetratricopeptide (TPR) repeat protein
MGDYEKAIEEFRKALEINPQAKGIHREIGRALVELGQFDEAIEELEKELRVFPNAGIVNFLLGQAYFKLKEYNKAREHYEAEIKVNPDYENAYYNLIRIYTMLKETEKAKETQLRFEGLREQSSKNERVQRMGKGLPGRDLSAIRDSVVRMYLDAEKLYRAKDDLKKAESLLKRAILIDPNNSKSFERLGLLYTMTERLPEALRQFERISKIEPSNPSLI